MKTLPSCTLVPQRTSRKSTPAPIARPSWAQASLGVEHEPFQPSLTRLESLVESFLVLVEEVLCELSRLRHAGLPQVESLPPKSETTGVWFQQLLEQLRLARSNSRRNRERQPALAGTGAENPHPVLQVDFSGEILGRNQAGAEFLSDLSRNLGDGVRRMFRGAITTMLSKGETTTLELHCGERDYLLTVAPVAGADYVYFYANDVSTLKQAQRHAQELAMRDPLTGLPNRVLLRERFNQALADCRRDRTPLAVAFIDLDNFKQINDTLGHGVGDLTLTSIARSLRQFVRGCDTVARWGGDEFVVLFPGFDKRDAERACKGLRAFAQRQAALQDHHMVSLSAGLAHYPEDGTDADQLLETADEALLMEKKRKAPHHQPEPGAPSPFKVQLNSASRAA